MTDLRKAAEMAFGVPLHEQLESVPEDARLVIEDSDGYGTRFIPVGRMCKEAVVALRQALAQGETVTWSKIDDPTNWNVDAVNMKQERVDETAKGEHEYVLDCPRCGHCCQKRKWVGLTDDERSYYLQAAANVGWWQASLFIEAKLKEKNCG